MAFFSCWNSRISYLGNFWIPKFLEFLNIVEFLNALLNLNIWKFGQKFLLEALGISKFSDIVKFLNPLNLSIQKFHQKLKLSRPHAQWILLRLFTYIYRCIVNMWDRHPSIKTFQMVGPTMVGFWNVTMITYIDFHCQLVAISYMIRNWWLFQLEIYLLHPSRL